MINAKTGTVQIGSIVIPPGLVEQTFVVLNPSVSKEPSIGTWDLYRLSEGEWNLLVSFEEGTVRQIAMQLSDGEPNSWHHWSVDRERHRKDAHDTRVREWLNASGIPNQHRSWSWGSGESVVDPHTGDASIVVTYAR
jgi:hypothetical protein